MSKVKPPKSKGVPSKHLHARTTFLYQAATYLTLHAKSNEDAASGLFELDEDKAGIQSSMQHVSSHSPLALQLGSDLQQVSRKAQLRLSVDLKRTMCKTCHTVLVPGCTATQKVENASKDAKKPWADVLVLTCRTCEGQKRFPIGAKRQDKKKRRKAKLEDNKSVARLDHVGQSDSAVQTSTEIDSNVG